jgi:hypothetical protein
MSSCACCFSEIISIPVAWQSRFERDSA